MNLDPALADKAKARAQSQRRSFAAYVATLIEADVSAAKSLGESPGTYDGDPITDGAQAELSKKNAAQPKPDKSASPAKTGAARAPKAKR